MVDHVGMRNWSREGARLREDALGLQGEEDEEEEGDDDEEAGV